MQHSKVENNITEPAFAVHEIGRVESIHKFVVNVKGLPSCINGQIVEFAQGGKGLVIGFTPDRVQVLTLKADVSIRTGDEVYNKWEPLLLPAGEAFLGRVVNGLAEPVDGLGPITPSGTYPVFRDAPAVLDRIPVKETLETGILSLDAGIPIAKGQRQLLIGDRLTGKTTVAIDAILNQKGKDVICIYCCIGKPYASLLKIFNTLREKGAMSYSIVISGIASASVGEQYLAPYTACMLGEYFMYNGRDVLVIFDDLTRHAWIYRQISLLLQRAPGREAYPGDIFYIHSQLMERAGYLKPELRGGSMTFFPIVEILQGDVTGYISTNAISMTDGQIYFSTTLFNKGFKPAIDFGLSVSRIGNKAQWPVMKELSKDLRIAYLQYQELLKMTQLRAAGLTKETEKRLKHGQAVTELLIQPKNSPISIEIQVLYLYALKRGILDYLSQAELKRFKQEFPTYVSNWYPGLLGDIRSAQNLSDTNKKRLDECLKRYIQKLKG